MNLSYLKFLQTFIKALNLLRYKILSRIYFMVIIVYKFVLSGIILTPRKMYILWNIVKTESQPTRQVLE
jgi:hypothetical protein